MRYRRALSIQRTFLRDAVKGILPISMAQLFMGMLILKWANYMTDNSPSDRQT
jgi:hypothetical protein